jgi:hypothetical protein
MTTNHSSRGQAGQEHAWRGPRHTSRREARARMGDMAGMVNMVGMVGMVDVG